VATDDVDERVRRAQAAIDPDRLVELCRALVDVPSPTGDERPLAEVLARLMREGGAEAHVQALDDRQANAWGRLPAARDAGAAAGASLMLYAPIDTMTTGDPGRDLPRVATEMDDHLVARAQVSGGRVVGLGAMNPKGHAACVLGATLAVAAAGIPLDGDLVAAFGAGGMPTNGVADPDGVVRRRHVGHGVGCSFLIEQGVWTDAAVIAKSGWAVSWEEVGLAWCDVTVHGTHTYVGARHLLPYRNPLADAATVVAFLEERFAARAARHRSGHVEPQAIVAAIDGGWWDMAAFTPATARLRVDLRLTPEQTPLEACRELDAELDDLRAKDPGLQVDVRLAVGIPGSRTPPDHPITRAAVAAWEAETGGRHEAATRTSGATDANILRHRGIPTVRVGLPKSTDGGRPLGFAAGMNTVDVDALVTLTRYLVRLAVAATSCAELRGVRP